MGVHSVILSHTGYEHWDREQRVCPYTKYCLCNIGEKECTPTLFVPHWLSCYRHNCNINCTEYYCIEQLMLLNYMKLRRIGASNRNVGKISFLYSCLQREPSSFYDYRSNWELSTFDRPVTKFDATMFYVINGALQRKFLTCLSFALGLTQMQDQ